MKEHHRFRATSLHTRNAIIPGSKLAYSLNRRDQYDTEDYGSRRVSSGDRKTSTKRSGRSRRIEGQNS